MKITTELIKAMNPCQDSLDNYLKNYADFTGSLREFFALTEIATRDKLWVFVRLKGIDEQLRRFAVLCMDRAQSDIQEVKDFQLLVMFLYESNNYSGDIEHLEDAEYSAAYGAAYGAADRAADSAANYAAYRAAYYAAYHAANRAADRAANYAADYAAYSAADRAAEQLIQLDIALYVTEEN